MKKYWIVFAKSLKSEMTYRFAALAGVVSALLGFLIQIFLWKALLGTGVQQDTSFSDMLVYVLINSFMMELTRANVASRVENAMVDGTVSLELLRPISYKYYMLANTFGENLYGTITRTVPILLVGAFFISAGSLPDPVHGALFVVSALLGALLTFQVTYLVGLLAFWLQRSWFISFYLGGFMKIFGGTVVPLWFYPQFLVTASYFLPFRYMTFEPINLFLGKTAVEDAWVPILAAALWLVVLSIADKLVLQAAVKKLTVNGG